MIKIKIEKPFKLEDTITCGQIFRFFKREDGSFDVILKDRVIVKELAAFREKFKKFCDELL